MPIEIEVLLNIYAHSDMNLLPSDYQIATFLKYKQLFLFANSNAPLHCLLV